MKKLIGGVAAGLALVLGGAVVAVNGTASAAVLPALPGNVTFLSGPRVAGGDGTAINANQTVAVKVAGQTFGGVSIPANATGLVLTVTSNLPAAAGIMTLWTTDAGRPGTAHVTFGAGQRVTNTVTVALNSDGKFNIWSNVKTHALIIINAYVTPEEGPAAPVFKSIPAKTATALDQVGGSIRGNKADNLKGATAFGKVTLPKGTWDARVLGGFTGLNNSTGPNNNNRSCTTGDNFLTGTMILVKNLTGNTPPPNNAYFEFDQVLATSGGAIIPESDSASLTQDPTLGLSAFITLSAETEVTVMLFGYESHSSTDCTGTLKGNLQSAQFLKVA